MSSTSHLDLAVAAILRKLADEPDVAQAVTILTKDYVTILAVLRIWRQHNAEFAKAYAVVGGRHPEALAEIEKFIQEGVKERERLLGV